MMNNVCSLCIPAAAGTQFTGTSFVFYVIIVHTEMALHSTKVEVHHHCEIAGSSFRSLPKIPHCCPPWKFGSCLRPNVAVRAPTPARGLRLGRLFSYQLPDLISAYLKAD